MNTNKNISENKLRELFGEIPFDEPSQDFIPNLLSRLEKEVVREKRKRQWTVVGQVAAGIFGILILPILTIYLCTIFLPGFSFTFSFPKIHFDLNLLTTGFAILLLLIIDTLFRMHISNRTKINSQ